MAEAADPAVDAFAAGAFAVADLLGLAPRPAPAEAGAAVAAPAELQATTPISSTAEPAKSARIPIAHRSISYAACRYRD
jgi:hypothetical protein